MKIVFFTNNQRGLFCIKHIERNFPLRLIISSNELKKFIDPKLFFNCPKNINSNNFINKIKKIAPDVIISGGFSQIFSEKFISSINCLWLNLHAGNLPKMRGSSPLNWALIKGQKSTSINIIKVNKKVDGGDIIKTKKLKINDDTTIAELHDEANKHFPYMLESVLKKYKQKKLKIIKQTKKYSYYPRRFKEDGFIIFDQYNAKQVHDKIRALSDPYPNAFSYFGKKKILFKKSVFLTNDFYGEPGRIYQVNKNKILICCLDKSIWINTNYDFKKNDRYKKMATLSDLLLNSYENK